MTSLLGLVRIKNQSFDLEEAKMYRSLLLAISIFSISLQAHAGKATGQVTAIKAELKKAQVMFELTSDETGAECNTSGWFVINTQKPGGQNIYNMVLDAYANRRHITVRAPDAGACEEEPGALTVKAVMMGLEKNSIPTGPLLIEEKD